MDPSAEDNGIANIPPMGGSGGLRIVLQDISHQWLRAEVSLAADMHDNGNVDGLPTSDVREAEENVTDQALGLRTRNRIAMANNIQGSSTSDAVADNDIILIDDTQPQEAQRNSAGTTPTSSRKRRR